MAPSTPARRLKPPPTESPVPWMPRHSGFKSDSTPTKLFARVARAIKSLKQLQTGVRVDHISMRAEGYGEIQARYENAANTMVTNPTRDKLICSLHETMLSIELEAAELMLLAQNAQFDADSLHQFAVYKEWTTPFSQQQGVGREEEGACTSEAPRHERRRSPSPAEAKPAAAPRGGGAGARIERRGVPNRSCASPRQSAKALMRYWRDNCGRSHCE